MIVASIKDNKRHGRILSEKLIAAEIFKKLAVFYATRRCIIFTHKS
jgi:hypothetical protein